MMTSYHIGTHIVYLYSFKDKIIVNANTCAHNLQAVRLLLTLWQRFVP